MSLGLSADKNGSYLFLVDQGPQHLEEADEGPHPKALLQDNLQGRGLCC